MQRFKLISTKETEVSVETEIISMKTLQCIPVANGKVPKLLWACEYEKAPWVGWSAVMN